MVKCKKCWRVFNKKKGKHIKHTKRPASIIIISIFFILIGLIAYSKIGELSPFTPEHLAEYLFEVFVLTFLPAIGLLLMKKWGAILSIISTLWIFGMNSLMFLIFPSCYLLLGMIFLVYVILVIYFIYSNWKLFGNQEKHMKKKKSFFKNNEN